MPRFDGTGPNGEGPRTGRRLGNCGRNGNRNSGKKERVFGRRLFGRRRRDFSEDEE